MPYEADKQAAAGVDQIEVDAVNARHKRELYAAHQKVYPKRISGMFRRIKWIVMALTLTVYYGTPWLRFDRGPSAPDQAVLLDMPNRKFYFFWIEIWPQEIYFLTGLLILAALALFLVTSLLGRVWCGYACPQTVWTDLFIHVERWIEGDRNARMRLDKAPWTMTKVGKRLFKHGVWIAIALATGGAWIFYFADAPTLLGQLLAFQAPAIAYISMGILTFTTWLLGGIAREQVCTYMCPWPRIQGAMFDDHSMLISYRKDRGEPRGSHKKEESWENRGDCIDCSLCVAVCPMGIDIRDGLQLECIQCALCIDACNSVMRKIDRPLNLIAYETAGAPDFRARGEPDHPQWVRPRTIIYAVLIALVSLLIVFGLSTRSTLDVNLLRDRNPLYVALSDGSIRNGYTLKILNKAHEDRLYTVSASGLAGLELTGGAGAPGDLSQVLVGADSLLSVRLFLTAQGLDVPTSGDATVTFTITESLTGQTVRQITAFRGPER